MSNAVFDASVLIAIARSERYEAGLLDSVEGAVISAVNFAEVLTRFGDLGLDVASREVRRALSVVDSVEPFTMAQAKVAADLRRLGKSVSLGDRACIALALERSADVYTADAIWGRFSLDIPVHIIR